jgi:hypothetical protein
VRKLERPQVHPLGALTHKVLCHVVSLLRRPWLGPAQHAAPGRKAEQQQQLQGCDHHDAHPDEALRGLEPDVGEEQGLGDACDNNLFLWLLIGLD